MKRIILLSMIVLPVLLQLTGCAPMRQTWPELAGNTEDRIISTQQKIGEGLQRNTLAIDHSQLFLARLEGIRHDYLQLRGRTVHRDQWDRLDQRLDALNRDIDTAIVRPGTIGGADLPRDRINAIQQRINNGSASGRLTPREVQKFQATLDFIRRDYIRMTEGNRYPSYEERIDISRRLDFLETDLKNSL